MCLRVRRRGAGVAEYDGGRGPVGASRTSTNEMVVGVREGHEQQTTRAVNEKESYANRSKTMKEVCEFNVEDAW